MRSLPWIVLVSSKGHHKCTHRELLFDSDTNGRGEGDVTTEAEARMYGYKPRDAGSWKPPRLERKRKMFSSGVLAGAQSSKTSNSDSGFQNCERIHFCCFKPPSFGDFLKQPQEINTWGFYLLPLRAIVRIKWFSMSTEFVIVPDTLKCYNSLY